MHARSWFPVVVVHVHVRVHENAFVEREKETMEGTNEKKAKGNGNEQGAEESEWGVGGAYGPCVRSAFPFENIEVGTTCWRL